MFFELNLMLVFCGTWYTNGDNVVNRLQGSTFGNSTRVARFERKSSSVKFGGWRLYLLWMGFLIRDVIGDPFHMICIILALFVVVLSSWV